MQTILVTGSAGFIGGYLVEKLLYEGFYVIGVDNYSKYGKVKKSYDENQNYEFHEHDAKDVDYTYTLLKRCDHFVACAAMIGGISYFHEYSYDLLAENERILASTFDAAIKAYKQNKLKKITVLSSSMIFESTNIFPSREQNIKIIPPPFSTYGFQKLCVIYFCKGAYEQYGLPYTILCPFNCVGIGEQKALNDKKIYSGNIKLAMSHVVPDLIKKIYLGQDPLHILGTGKQIRHYTAGEDLAEGIFLSLNNEKAKNEMFNLSTNVSTTVLDLAIEIWKRINKDKMFDFVIDQPFEYDVQKRIPDTTKAKILLGFEAKKSLGKILDEIIPWYIEALKKGIL